jgi:hypothetical protein
MVESLVAAGQRKLITEVAAQELLRAQGMCVGRRGTAPPRVRHIDALPTMKPALIQDESSGGGPAGRFSI